jgi:hypothetical protein
VDQQLAEDLAAIFHSVATAFYAYAQRKVDAEHAAEDEAFAQTRATVTSKVFSNTPTITKIIDADTLRRQSGGPVRQP